MKASKAGKGKKFGMSGGGSEGVHTKLYSSPMESKFVPKFKEAAAKGKTHNMVGGSKKGY